MYYCYLYIDPITDIPRYVGKGKFDRWSERHSNKQLSGWLENLKTKPIVEFVYATNELSAFWLEKLAIKAFGRLDQNTGTLFNHTDGGEGKSGFITKQSTKLQISHSLKNTYKNNPELVFANREKQKEAQNRPDVKKRKSETLKRVLNKPEIMEKTKAALLLAMNRPEVKEKLRLVRKNNPPKKVVCPYCGKEGGNNIMHLHHFENCKRK